MARTVSLFLLISLSIPVFQGCCLRYIGAQVGEGAQEALIEGSGLTKLMMNLQMEGVAESAKEFRRLIMDEETRRAVHAIGEEVTSSGTTLIGAVAEQGEQSTKRALEQIESAMAELEGSVGKMQEALFGDEAKARTEEFLNAQADIIDARTDEYLKRFTDGEVRQELDRVVTNTSAKAKSEMDALAAKLNEILTSINMPMIYAIAALILVIVLVLLLPNVLLFFAHRRAQKTIRELNLNLIAVKKPETPSPPAPPAK
ncbi:MAG: hypothetical protein NUW37_06420 [Planctomycetes bacterium]|nr:hypothetical protein [Planctomycetota bacterium]